MPSFSSWDLRDHDQERKFLEVLKEMGVPVTDKKLIIRLDEPIS